MAAVVKESPNPYAIFSPQKHNLDSKYIKLRESDYFRRLEDYRNYPNISDNAKIESNLINSEENYGTSYSLKPRNDYRRKLPLKFPYLLDQMKFQPNRENLTDIQRSEIVTARSDRIPELKQVKTRKDKMNKEVEKAPEAFNDFLTLDKLQDIFYESILVSPDKKKITRENARKAQIRSLFKDPVEIRRRYLQSIGRSANARSPSSKGKDASVLPEIEEENEEDMSKIKSNHNEFSNLSLRRRYRAGFNPVPGYRPRPEDFYPLYSENVDNIESFDNFIKNVNTDHSYVKSSTTKNTITNSNQTKSKKSSLLTLRTLAAYDKVEAKLSTETSKTPLSEQREKENRVGDNKLIEQKDVEQEEVEQEDVEQEDVEQEEDEQQDEQDEQQEEQEDWDEQELVVDEQQQQQEEEDWDEQEGLVEDEQQQQQDLVEYEQDDEQGDWDEQEELLEDELQQDLVEYEKQGEPEQVENKQSVGKEETKNQKGLIKDEQQQNMKQERQVDVKQQKDQQLRNEKQVAHEQNYQEQQQSSVQQDVQLAYQNSNFSKISSSYDEGKGRNVSDNNVTPRNVTLTKNATASRNVTPRNVTPRNVTLTKNATVTRNVTPRNITPRTVTPRTVTPTNVTPRESQSVVTSNACYSSNRKQAGLEVATSENNNCRNVAVIEKDTRSDLHREDCRKFSSRNLNAEHEHENDVEQQSMVPRSNTVLVNSSGKSNLSVSESRYISDDKFKPSSQWITSNVSTMIGTSDHGNVSCNNGLTQKLLSSSKESQCNLLNTEILNSWLKEARNYHLQNILQAVDQIKLLEILPEKLIANCKACV